MLIILRVRSGSSFTNPICKENAYFLYRSAAKCKENPGFLYTTSNSCKGNDRFAYMMAERNKQVALFGKGVELEVAIRDNLKGIGYEF